MPQMGPLMWMVYPLILFCLMLIVLAAFEGEKEVNSITGSTEGCFKESVEW